MGIELPPRKVRRMQKQSSFEKEFGQKLVSPIKPS
jgi:hypothetical protein